MILPSCTIIHAENKVIFAQNKDCSAFARCASHTRRIRFFAENTPKMPDLRPLPSHPSHNAACPRYNKTCPGFWRRGGTANTCPLPRPSPAVDRVRRRDTPPPRRPPTQKNTRRFRAGCLFDVCNSVFAPSRGDADVMLPSTALGAVQNAGSLYRQVVALALTTLIASSCAPFSTTSILMVCVPAASSVLSRTVNGLFCTAASVASMVYSFKRISST